YDRLAATLNHSFAEIERLVDSLRTATDALAHDLKTPLTRIRSRLELAALGGDQNDAMSDMRSDLDALLRTIDDTLRLARAETTMASEFVPVDLAAIVGEAVELFEPVAEDRGLLLNAKVSPAIVSGVRSLLGQLVTNLIDNAIKYTPPGGLVSVSLGHRRDGLWLIVSDTGPGIHPDQREHALSRFVRLDASRNSEGSGLGLNIALVAARVHGARLALADNTPGLRAEVHFPNAI
ncbi:MAG: HAMP domain-containing histidine kinase, partial [Oxalobacteraceae bacterium]